MAKGKALRSYIFADRRLHVESLAVILENGMSTLTHRVDNIKHLSRRLQRIAALILSILRMLELDLAAHPSRIDVTTQRVVQTESLIEELLNDYATLTTCGKDFGDLIDSIRDDWCRNVGLLLQLLSTEGNLADDGHRRALEGRLRSVAEKIRTVKVILGHADGLEVDESAGPADSGGNAREDEGINLKFPQIKELLKQPELLCRLRNVAGVGTEHWNELKGELFREGDRIGSELRVD